MFEPVAARYDGPELEKGILDLWRRENVFGRIMAEGAARPKFVFYEGPPTARHQEA
jgi:isoleucyl-tRNA synthetase